MKTWVDDKLLVEAELMQQFWELSLSHFQAYGLHVCTVTRQRVFFQRGKTERVPFRLLALVSRSKEAGQIHRETRNRSAGQRSAGAVNDALGKLFARRLTANLGSSSPAPAPANTPSRQRWRRREA